MTTPMSLNGLTSNMTINGNQVYMPALSQVNSFLQSPLDSDMALSKQFNPTGSNGDFFKMLSSLMGNFKIQTAQSASMLQTMSSTSSPFSTSSLTNTLSSALGTATAPAAKPGALSPTDIGAISNQLSTIISSIKTMLPAMATQGTGAKISNASADANTNGNTSKGTVANAANGNAGNTNGNAGNAGKAENKNNTATGQDKASGDKAQAQGGTDKAKDKTTDGKTQGQGDTDKANDKATDDKTKTQAGTATAKDKATDDKGQAQDQDSGESGDRTHRH